MKIIFALLLFSFTQVYANNLLHFNDKGDIVKPDFEQVRIGLELNKKGKPEAAMKRYQKAARYGNYYAITLIASRYIEQKNYIQSLAWLKLIDLTRTQQKDVITNAMDLLEKKLSTQGLQTAEQRYLELVKIYGHEAASTYREKWRNKLQFTGTHTRGRVPQNLTIVLEAEGNIENTSKMTVTGHEIKAQLNQYVLEYDFDIPIGEVVLSPIEMIED